MKSFAHLLWATFLLTGARASLAQTGAPTPNSSPTGEMSIDEARSLAHNEALWNKALNWNEKNASLQTVVTHVRAALGQNAPPIEVRAPDVNRSTFTLAKAPIGTTLVSLAKLANCEVWVFVDGLVIAPKSALSNEERAAIQRHAGGDWTHSSFSGGSSQGWSGRRQFESAATRTISTELKARRAAKDQADPVTVAPHKSMGENETAPYELRFGELSTTTQRVLQELFSKKIERSTNLAEPPRLLSFLLPLPADVSPSSALPKPVETTTLPPTTLVCFDDTRPNWNQAILFLKSDELNLDGARWYVEKSK